MKIMLTGASGFVGSHVLRHIMTVTDWTVVAPVSFRHKGLPERVASAMAGHDLDRLQVPYWDMRAPAPAGIRRRAEDCDVFMNVASESHVDRSITDPGEFIRNNTDLILNVLDLARSAQPRLFLQMSTDEVYGPAYGDTRHKEWDSVIPSNPYSASKAAQEAICTAYWRTYGVPVVITNTMNIIGEMQDPEKFLPMIIRRLRNGQPVTVHTAPDGTPGSRFYLHARNLADAWVWLTRQYTQDPVEITSFADPEPRFAETGPPLYSRGFHRPDRLHIVGERETPNTDLVYGVGQFMGLEEDAVTDLIKPVSFHASRPGHDLRYALDGSLLSAYGWQAPVGFDEALERTVHWYLDNPAWLDV
jgi:dTDP-glucose 4,6-dehydratase